MTLATLSALQLISHVVYIGETISAAAAIAATAASTVALIAVPADLDGNQTAEILRWGAVGAYAGSMLASGLLVHAYLPNLFT
jgi:FtsH-binding integral membrane protein